MEQAHGTSSSSNTNIDSLSKAKHRAWCFTSWEQDIPDVIQMRRTPNGDVEEEPKKGITYIVIGAEHGEDLGGEHWQGFIYFTNPRTFGGVKKLLGERVHISPRYKDSTNEQAIEYCKKEGEWREWGQAPNSNGKKNINEVVNQYDNINNFMQEESDLYCRYRNGIKDLFNARIVAHSGPREVIWIYGPSGCGKSRHAREICEDNPISYENSFFDYNGETEVIFDDFRASDMKLNLLLRITDRYKMNVNVKGGSKPWAVKKIVFTSILPPWEMYRDSGENLIQIRRRITTIIDMNPHTTVKRGSVTNEMVEALKEKQ